VLRARLVIAELETGRGTSLLAPHNQIKVVRLEPPALRFIGNLPDSKDFGEHTHIGEPNALGERRGPSRPSQPNGYLLLSQQK